MTSHFTIKQYFWIVLLAFLVACGPVPTEQPVTPTATSTPTFTSVPPTSTGLPIENPSTTPTPLPLFPLDGYIVVFRQDGNLYFQDGNTEPVQLTLDGKNSNFLAISEDNRKIIFEREGSSTIYSINSDGTGEQELITSQWLDAFGDGTRMRSPAFVPGTHRLFFNTYLCEPPSYDPLCSIGLFPIDVDTGQIKIFRTPDKAGKQYSLYDNFKVSPDGKMIAIGTVGHIDILDLDGKALRKNILSYEPSTPYAPFPVPFWLPDSSGLIVALPTTTTDLTSLDFDAPTFTVWRYTIENNETTQIPLDPSPMIDRQTICESIQVSPDGNWMLHGGGQYTGLTSVYLGDLSNGQSQLLTNDPFGACFNSSWSPDSKHFVYRYTLGVINRQPVVLNLSVLENLSP